MNENFSGFQMRIPWGAFEWPGPPRHCPGGPPMPVPEHKTAPGKRMYVKGGLFIRPELDGAMEKTNNFTN